MKNNYLLFFSQWLFIFMMTILVGCTSLSSPPVQEQGTGNTNGLSEATAELTATEVSTVPASTDVSTPTATMTPSLSTPTSISTTILPSATVTSSPILTPVPTLNSIEEGALVQELMVTNGGCQLPCWWGIQLGESLENIGDVFTNLGVGPWRVSASSFGNDGKRGYIKMGYFNSTISAYNIDISMDFYTVNDAVQFIEVSAERPFPQYGEEIFVQDWEKYSLSSILQTYSKPPYVYLIPQNVVEPGPPIFILILYYPEMGFKFSYQPYGTLSNDDDPELCLNLENLKQLSLSVYNPEFIDGWADYLLPPALNPGAEEYLNQWTWEVQTGMDLDIFYETYKDPNNLGCIQIQ